MIHGSDDTYVRAVPESLAFEHCYIYIEPELKDEGLEWIARKWCLMSLLGRAQSSLFSMIVIGIKNWHKILTELEQMVCLVDIFKIKL